MGQSPMLSVYAGWLAWLVPVLELLIVGLLVFPRTRLLGLMGAFTLMVMFTVYIYIILNYASYVPCSCGGVLEKLGWGEHLVFNMAFIFLALLAIYIALHPSLNYLNLSKRFVLTTLNILTIGAISTVTLLYNSSEKQMHTRNPFIRRFTQHPLRAIAEKDLKLNSFYISGFNKGNIYLSNQTAPLLVKKLDTSLLKTENLRLSIPKDSLPYRAVRTMIIPPYFFIVDGSIPYVLRGLLKTKKADYKKINEFFSLAVPVRNDSLVVRARNHTNNENVLGTLSLVKEPQLTMARSILKKQIDGVFDTDGTLIYNKEYQKVLYTYFYRNQYTIAESDLSSYDIANTIDTISKAQISIDTISSRAIRKLSKPPLMVNKLTATSGRYLFINSGIMGNYESSKVWDRSSVIDVYDFIAQSYIGSFRIQHIGKEKLSDFRVEGNLLVCLVGTHLQTYRIRDRLFR
ncbi:DoxX family protein [Galbibacter sp. CAA-3]|nr:DoxX family protein [Galbibacter pacificus]